MIGSTPLSITITSGFGDLIPMHGSTGILQRTSRKVP